MKSQSLELWPTRRYAFVITGLWVINFLTSTTNLSSSTFLHTGVTTKNVTLKSTRQQEVRRSGSCSGRREEQMERVGTGNRGGCRTGVCFALHTPRLRCVRPSCSVDWFYWNRWTERTDYNKHWD